MEHVEPPSPRSENFEFYCVLDFEANGDNSPEFGPCEVIEFPSVLVNSHTLERVAEFQLFVKPSQPLNRFCIAKTGITQKQVDTHGVTLSNAVEAHRDWLYGHVGCHSFVMVTCGDWDLKTQLPEQCRRESVKRPEYFNRFVNIKEVFNAAYHARITGMKGMLKQLKIPLEGHHHSGIDDCRNIASIVLWLLKTFRDGRRLQPMKRAARKAKKPVKPYTLAWAAVGDGFLALSHRPSRRNLRLLYDPDMKCSCLVTLLSKKEGGEMIGELIKAQNSCRRDGRRIQWMHIPMEGATPPHDEAEMLRLLGGIQRIDAALSEGHHVLLHCSAGIHRTGMIANALLLWRGLSGGEALAVLRTCRAHTADGVGEHRLEWGETLISRHGSKVGPL